MQWVALLGALVQRTLKNYALCNKIKVLRFGPNYKATENFVQSAYFFQNVFPQRPQVHCWHLSYKFPRHVDFHKQFCCVTALIEVFNK